MLYFSTSLANQRSTAWLTSDFCAHVVFAAISLRRVATSNRLKRGTYLTFLPIEVSLLLILILTVLFIHLTFNHLLSS